MDLMKGTTSYAQLKKKYHGFAAPTAQISVEGTEIIGKLGASISDLRVDLTSDYQASGCSFSIAGEYRPDQTDFNRKGCYKKLEIGAKVEVALGYITVETVFVGLITSLEYEFDEDAPLIHVECMDAKCLLMKRQRLELLDKTTTKQALSTIFKEAPVSQYISKQNITIKADEKGTQILPMESDYEYIVRRAQYTGSEFFIISGQVYFRPIPGASSAIMELSPDTGLIAGRQTLQGIELVKTVQVMGIDPTNDKAISGKADVSGKFGAGSTPRKMINGAERIYFDPLSKTAAQAQSRAKTLMDGLTAKFSTIRLTCIGIPELVPGRRVKVKGLSTRATGSFYITEVSHRLGPDGYTTIVEARGNSL